MNTTGKWLARVGALLFMLGFILPSLTVSCALAPGYGGSVSLADLASSPYTSMPLLYLVPIGGLAVLVFSFLPAKNRSNAMQFLIGQLVGLVVSILSVVLSLLTLSSQMGSNQGLQISPEIGIFILLIGYILCAVGLIYQWQEVNQAFPANGTFGFRDVAISSPEHLPQYAPAPLVGLDQHNVRLELLQGNLPYSVIPIYSDNFTIGRSSSNNLQIPDDETVSRQHARIRYAQNAWFIQDWESTGGTFVNGKEVRAARLNPGDQISVGGTTFVFRM